MAFNPNPSRISSPKLPFLSTITRLHFLNQDKVSFTVAALYVVLTYLFDFSWFNTNFLSFVIFVNVPRLHSNDSILFGRSQNPSVLFFIKCTLLPQYYANHFPESSSWINLLFTLTSTPSPWNEPHHSLSSHDNSVFFQCGLLRQNGQDFRLRIDAHLQTVSVLRQIKFPHRTSESLCFIFFPHNH